jgi:tetratricopeptide (TPR) repeat protein
MRNGRQLIVHCCRFKHSLINIPRSSRSRNFLQTFKESAKTYELLSPIYQLIYPSQFEMKKDLAMRYLKFVTTSDCYERAWTLSHRRFTRAKRTLGKICYDRGDFQTAIQRLSQALTIQPLVHTA